MSDERRDERVGPDPEGGRDTWLDRLMQRFNRRPRESMRDDLEEVLAEATAAADLSAHERTMLANVLAFHRVRVADVMVPRSEVIAASGDTTLGELLGLFRTIGHSRLPVYRETLDEPLGMVHIRDLVNHVTGLGDVRPDGPEGAAQVASLGGIDLSATLASADILRPVLFVPGSMPAIDLLARMQASRTHIALVIDEYGGTDGLVSIEDLVETVVGDIEDEHDTTTDFVLQEDGGDYLVDARADLDEVSEAIGRDLTAGLEAADVDTLGGLVVTHAGRVPLRGERFAGPHGLEFEVVDADRRRLKRIRVRLRNPAGAAESGAPAGAAETEPARADRRDAAAG